MTRRTKWSVDRKSYRTGPPGSIIPVCVCDACARFDYVPLQPGNVCYWCQRGTFTHRGLWTFSWCPACDGEDPFCEACFGNRIVATPAE